MSMTTPTTTTSTHDIIGGTTLYGGQAFRIFFASGDHDTFEANADNPRREWMVRRTFTMYGGRCESFTETGLGLSFAEGVTRDEAEAAMIVALGADAVR